MRHDVGACERPLADARACRIYGARHIRAQFVWVVGIKQARDSRATDSATGGVHRILTCTDIFAGARLWLAIATSYLHQSYSQVRSNESSNYLLACIGGRSCSM